jgi:hypothetical protein
MIHVVFPYFKILTSCNCGPYNNSIKVPKGRFMATLSYDFIASKSTILNGATDMVVSYS